MQPGEPNASVLIRAIGRVDKDLKMPPDDEDQLTADEIQDFVAWVKRGVPFPGGAVGEPASAPTLDLAKARQFWSLRPLLESTPPQPERAAHNRIDEFVRAKLQAAGMQPSAPADTQSILRRATYDLTGLPPTPTEIDAFLADTSPKAFANVVERLLDSPQFGAHWARHWFDVARYGDTRWGGAGEDRRWPFAYTYRDWVIEALNEDMPYDRFVTLQLAADPVPDARQADQAALGFLTVGRWFTGTQPDVIDDQIDVVTRGLLGVSAQCARCHDHKYDPISTQDYYSLYGLFAAAQMPVDGTGVLAELPEVRSRPVDAATEQEIAALRGRVDEFLNTRLTDLRNRFRTSDKMRQYMTAAEGLLPKMDNDVRAFAKSQELDDRILLGQRVTGFEPFPAFVNGQWRGGPQDSDPVLGRASLNARGGDAGPSSELAVIRRWIAPGGGRLSVAGAVSSQLNSTQPQGDGVRARIVSSRLGQLGVWLVHGTEEQTDLQGVDVEQGDAIDFVVDARGRDMHGSFAWSPVLRLDAADNSAMATSVWDSAKDFKNPTATTTTATFDVWERYAQVLLETNEFLFLD